MIGRRGVRGRGSGPAEGGAGRARGLCAVRSPQCGRQEHRGARGARAQRGLKLPPGVFLREPGQPPPRSVPRLPQPAGPINAGPRNLQ